MPTGLITSCVGTLLKHIIDSETGEGIDVTGWRGRRCKQLLDYLRETRRYWKLKEEELFVTQNVLAIENLTHH